MSSFAVKGLLSLFFLTPKIIDFAQRHRAGQGVSIRDIDKVVLRIRQLGRISCELAILHFFFKFGKSWQRKTLTDQDIEGKGVFWGGGFFKLP